MYTCNALSDKTGSVLLYCTGPIRGCCWSYRSSTNGALNTSSPASRPWWGPRWYYIRCNDTVSGVIMVSPRWTTTAAARGSTPGSRPGRRGTRRASPATWRRGWRRSAPCPSWAASSPVLRRLRAARMMCPWQENELGWRIDTIYTIFRIFFLE